MNGDRLLDLAEYMKAVFGEGALEGEWKEGEEQFRKERDLNQDGFMDKEEVRSWMLPDTYDEHQVGLQSSYSCYLRLSMSKMRVISETCWSNGRKK